MTDITVLKRYRYKGFNIAIRLIGNDVIEYLFAYRGHIFTQSFDRHESKHKLKAIGAATLIVCNAAESVVDQAIQKFTLQGKLKTLLGIGKVAAEPQHLTDETKNEKDQSSGEHQGPGQAEGLGSPRETPKPDDEVRKQGAEREDGKKDSKG